MKISIVSFQRIPIKRMFVILTLFLSVNNVFCQSKIEKSKNELTKKSNYRSSKDYSTGSSNRNNESLNEGFFLGFFSHLFELLFYESLKYTLIGDYKNENHLYNSITKYPYYNKKYYWKLFI